MPAIGLRKAEDGRRADLVAQDVWEAERSDRLAVRLGVGARPHRSDDAGDELADQWSVDGPVLPRLRRVVKWIRKEMIFMRGISRLITVFTIVLIGGTIMMIRTAAAVPNAATDPRIDPQVRAFLADLKKESSPFWELPQPKPQEILTGLQNKTPV